MKRFLSGLLALVMAVSLLPQMVMGAAGVSRSYGLNDELGRVEYHNDYTGLHITGSTDWFFTNDMEVAYLHYDDMDPVALREMTPAQFAKLPVIYDMGASAMDSQDRFDISIYNTKHWKNTLIRKESAFIKHLRNNMGKGAKARRGIDPVELSGQTFQVQEYYFDDFVRYVAYQMRSDGYVVVVQFDSYDIEPERFWNLFNGGMLSDKISRSWEWDSGVYVNDFTGLTFHLWDGWNPVPDYELAEQIGLTEEAFSEMDHGDFKRLAVIPDVYAYLDNDYVAVNIYNPARGGDMLQSPEAFEAWAEELFPAEGGELQPWQKHVVGGREMRVLQAVYKDCVKCFAYEYREDGCIVSIELQSVVYSPYAIFAMFDGAELPGAETANVPDTVPFTDGAYEWENADTGIAITLPKGWRVAYDEYAGAAFYGVSGEEYRAFTAEEFAPLSQVVDLVVYDGLDPDYADKTVIVRYINRSASKMFYGMDMEEVYDRFVRLYTTSESRGVNMPDVEVNGRKYDVVAQSFPKYPDTGVFTLIAELNEDYFIEISCYTYDGTTLKSFLKLFQ